MGPRGVGWAVPGSSCYRGVTLVPGCGRSYSTEVTDGEYKYGGLLDGPHSSLYSWEHNGVNEYKKN